MPRTYQAGDVVIVTLPFTSGTGSKARPAVVLLDTGDNDLIVAGITTQGARTEFDVELDDPTDARLNDAGCVRVDKPQTVDKRLVKRTGRLSTPDWQLVASKVKELWSLLS